MGSLVVQVEILDAEPAQRAFDGQGKVVGREHPAAWLAVDRVDVLGELGGDHHLAGVRGERLADELLVEVRPIDLGGVEERDTLFHGPTQQGDRVVPVRRAAVAAGHRHAAQPQGRDLESTAS
jgi:hypothetical protein